MERTDDLEKRIRKLEDIEEIRTLRMRYHQFINEQMYDRVHELFTSDAIVDFEFIGRAEGIEQINSLYLRIPNAMNLVVQFIHNHMVDVTGDEATGLSYLDARYARNGESVIVAAYFDEKYRRTVAGWRISYTRLHLYFAVPVSQGWAAGELLQAPQL